MGRKIKVGTKVQILFRPLKKVFLKRGWESLYKELKKDKGNKRKLILSTLMTPPDGVKIECPKYNKEDGTYYTFNFFNTSLGAADSCNIPTSCFKIIGDKKKRILNY